MSTPPTIMGGPSSARTVLKAWPVASSTESGSSNTQFASLASIITLCSPDFFQTEKTPTSVAAERRYSISPAASARRKKAA